MYDLVAVVIHCGSGPNRGHCKLFQFHIMIKVFNNYISFKNILVINVQVKYIRDPSHHLFLDISIVKSCGFWLIFDDDLVDVSKYFYHFNNDTGCPYNLAHLFRKTIELCISEN